MNTKRTLASMACLAFAASSLAISPAMAQTAPGAPGSNDVIPEKQAPPSPPTKGEADTTTGRSLSQKLDQSGGVIKPPSGVDPDISKAPPVADPGSMPVIKPPAGSEAK